MPSFQCAPCWSRPAATVAKPMAPMDGSNGTEASDCVDVPPVRLCDRPASDGRGSSPCGAVNLHPPRVRPRRRKNTVKIPGSGWTAERSPECGSLPLLRRTSTSLGACGWPTGCLVLSSVRGLQMNVCRINGTRSLVERSHECPRRSDQTISMHTWRSYRVWMGLSPSIELNNANGKTVHMPSTYCTKPYRIATSPAFRRKLSSQQASVLKSAPKRALYLRGSSRFAA